MKVDPHASDSLKPLTLTRWLLWPLLLLVMLALTACLSLLDRGGDEAAPEGADTGGEVIESVPAGSEQQFGDIVVLPPGIGYLSCTEACGNFGQCGLTPELGTVVLLNTQGPAGRVHDYAVPAGTEIDINSATEELVFPIVGEGYTARYYNVNVRGRGPAWVAGWCVSSLP